MSSQQPGQQPGFDAPPPSAPPAYEVKTIFTQRNTHTKNLMFLGLLDWTLSPTFDSTEIFFDSRSSLVHFYFFYFFLFFILFYFILFFFVPEKNRFLWIVWLNCPRLFVLSSMRYDGPFGGIIATSFPGNIFFFCLSMHILHAYIFFYYQTKPRRNPHIIRLWIFFY